MSKLVSHWVEVMRWVKVAAVFSEKLREGWPGKGAVERGFQIGTLVFPLTYGADPEVPVLPG